MTRAPNMYLDEGTATDLQHYKNPTCMHVENHASHTGVRAHTHTRLTTHTHSHTQLTKHTFTHG